MRKRGISQETLKLIACVTMLIDHIGYMFGLGLKLRVIGRLAFPIYCFLIAEGAYHTQNPKKYALRLAIGALIAEFAFDFAFFGIWTWQYQSVMVTLLLGYLALTAMKRFDNPAVKTLSVVPFAVLADLLSTDYGWQGVLLVALFGVARDLPWKWLAQTVGMAVLFWLLPSAKKEILSIQVPIQMFGLVSLVLIGLYSGRKITRNKVVQWAFYLFYPVHMVLLRLIWEMFYV